jgi:hypothetical protein
MYTAERERRGIDAAVGYGEVRMPTVMKVNNWIILIRLFWLVFDVFLWPREIRELTMAICLVVNLTG